ncbi:MAG TPA: Gldg family protein [Nostocaceae cyanobacterium]|nr:Gldg family protein [Nostocaceae cyanobacterium]
MTNYLKKHLGKLLFWLGPFSLMVGLTAGLISGKWDLISLTFIIIGSLIIGLWIVIQSRKNNWLQQRSTQVGTNAIVATLSVLIILGLINFLGTRYQYRIDLTETQLFTLAPQSRELVRTLPQKIKVWLFTTGVSYPPDRELLENYRRQSPKFEFEYADPQARPGLAEKFGLKEDGEVYLEYGDKRQFVQNVNEAVRLSEINLTNRLLQITSSSAPKVYFLQGHGEHELSGAKGALSQAVQGLSDKFFNVAPLNLAETPQVPEDAAVVVVAGPKNGLLAGEVQTLQTYLNRGGNLLLMIDPNTDPKIDSILQEWGVRLGDRLVIDLSGETIGLGPAAILVTQYGQHPISKDFGNNISLFPLTRPIEITPVSGIESTPLLKTKPFPDSWAESDQQSEKLEFNEGKDIKGPLTLGVALTRKTPEKTQVIPTTSPTPTPTPTSTTSPTPTPTSTTSPTPTPTSTPSPTPTTPTTTKESRLVVIGNSDFATNGLFQENLNKDVFLNSVTWLSQQDQKPLSISPKEPKNRRLNLSSTQASFLQISVFVLPLIGLGASAIVWLKRR